MEPVGIAAEYSTGAGEWMTMDEMNRVIREFRLARLAAMRAVRDQYPVGVDVQLHSGGVKAKVQESAGGPRGGSGAPVSQAMWADGMARRP